MKNYSNQASRTCARPFRRTFARAAASLVAALALAGPLLAADEPLHVKIDALIALANPAGQTPLAGDADYLRRTYLALHGVIPTAAQARAFFADAAPDKRAKLVDALLADPQYARWMAVRFDVMLMERRGETHTKAAPWREWLEASFAANKPWDAMVRELFSADSADEKTRPIARWVLEREANPHALTKDTARLFLGRDIGCAQCHDHPRIDDYSQRDYAGLQAFFGRTYLFKPDDKVPGVVGEQAAGETSYVSVFTKVGGETKARLPGEPEIAEPAGGEWKVAPDPKNKKLQPIPKVSRRGELVAALGDGHHPAFRRNIANRLWALVFGRGLVEPLDLMHSANPPANPALLDLLAERIGTMKFDMRAFVRELALTEAFQRTLDLPELPAGTLKAVAERAPAMEKDAAALASAAFAVEGDATKALKATHEAFRAAEPVKAERAKADAAVAAAAKISEAAVAGQKTAEAALAAKRDAQKALAEAAAKVREALARAGESPELLVAAKTFQTKADTTATGIPPIEKSAAEKRVDAEAKAQAFAASQQAATAAKARVDEAVTAINARQADFEALETRKEVERIKAKFAAAQSTQINAALAFSAALAADKPAQDAAAKAEGAVVAAKTTVDRLTAEIAAGPARLAALESTASATVAEAAKAKDGMTAKGPAAAVLAEAAAKAAEALAKLPDDAEVKAATATVKAKADAVTAEVAALQKTLVETQAKADAAARQLADGRSGLERARAELAAAQGQAPALQAAATAARGKANQTSAPVAAAREALESAWGRSFAAAELIPLAPEQLCWSMMQATGQLDAQRTASAAEWDGKNKLTDADKANPAKQAERTAGIDKLFRAKVVGHENQFVRSFGGAAGQPQTDFFATPEQALYFENGGVARQWAANLAARAAALPQPKAMAEELYLSTLTRLPAEGEIAQVAATLSTRPPEKKTEALADYAWALVTSVEFRFSH
jgi:hypothetical protein